MHGSNATPVSWQCSEIYIVCDFIGCSGNDARGGYSSGVHSIIVGGWCELETERVVALTHWSWRETESPPHTLARSDRGAGWKEECHRVHKVGCCGMCDE